MTLASLPPFIAFYAGALLIALTGGRLRQALLVLTPFAGALLLFQAGDGNHWQTQLFGIELTLYRVDRLSLLFGYLFHIAAFILSIYALHARDPIQYAAGMVYAGSAVGAVLAGDLLTLFVFWELLAISSVFLIWAQRTERAVGVGLRYLLVQVLSGVLLLSGALIHIQATGSATFGELELAGLAPWLIFLAFGIKCGFPLLHNWLIDAYPEATAVGTVFLSAFTTKTAVYALARSFAGEEILIYIGAAMTCFPIFFAVIENDLRRVLAYSMINQLGFMVTGIGIGTALAVNGAVAHAFNDVLFKGLLFMSMGAVLYMTGRTKASDLGGLYKTMPVTATLCIVGAASISAFPLFNGFVSKAMIMSALLHENHWWVWVALLFASAGVLEHAGIKIPYFAFFAHDSGIRAQEPPRNMLVAMTLSAALCIGIGCLPQVFYGLLPHAVDYTPYDVTHVVGQLQLLFFAILGVAVLHLTGLYPAEIRAINLDFDWVYRRLAPRLVAALGGLIGAVDRSARAVALSAVRGGMQGLARHHGGEGLFSRTWPTGSMVLWVGILLAVLLLANLL